MPILRDIHFWPPTGREDQPWLNDHDDSRCDALLRTARRVCERYSDALRSEELSSRHSSIRLFVGIDDRSDVLVEIGVDPDDDFGRVTVPPGVVDLGPARRAALLLEVINGGMRRLGKSRDWDPAAIDRVRRAVIDHDFGFAWDGPWKSSRSRAHRARLRFVLEDDGFGAAYVEVEDVKHGQTYRGPAVRSFSTVEGFRRSAKTLRWTDNTTVEAQPFIGLFNDSHGSMTWKLDEVESVPSTMGWPPPSDVPVAGESGLAFTVVGTGRTAQEQPHQ